MMASVPYILDTNILVHSVRGDAVWSRIRSEYNLLAIEPTPLISVVTVGELRSLAVQHRWGETKLDQMAFLLGYFERIPIAADDLIDAYAVIDSTMAGRGHFLGKNDLWIAATTVITGARLLTTDTDFDPLSPSIITRDWIDPRPPPSPRLTAPSPESQP